MLYCFFFFQAEDGIRDLVRSRGLGDVYKRQGQYNLSVDGEPVILQITDVDISSEDIPGWTVANKGSLTVALDVTITAELEAEGNAREFVNRIQKIRKDSGFELTDRIEVTATAVDGLKDSLAQFKDYICAEILADKLEFVPVIPVYYTHLRTH